MTDLAPHLRPATEAQIEAAITDLFLCAGWYPVKTDAGMVSRGQRRRGQRGHIQLGFPDMTYLLGIPGTALCLAALIETKSATGKLRASQTERHAELRDLYNIRAHVIRDAAGALNLIAEGRQLVTKLKDKP